MKPPPGIKPDKSHPKQIFAWKHKTIVCCDTLLDCLSTNWSKEIDFAVFIVFSGHEWIKPATSFATFTPPVLQLVLPHVGILFLRVASQIAPQLTLTFFLHTYTPTMHRWSPTGNQCPCQPRHSEGGVLTLDDGGLRLIWGWWGSLDAFHVLQVEGVYTNTNTLKNTITNTNMGDERRWLDLGGCHVSHVEAGRGYPSNQGAPPTNKKPTKSISAG